MEIVMIGAGNMGGAILRGMKEGPYAVTVSTHKADKVASLKAAYPFATVKNEAVADIEGKVVILAVKPQVYQSVKTKGTARALISVMAGISLASLKEQFSAENYLRAMPNVAASKNLSATAFTGDEGFKTETEAILASFGQGIWVGSEKELNVATALAGSGPAYMMLIAEALADGAVRMGLKRPAAQQLVQGLFEGSAALLSDGHPGVIKDSVMSPGGTTAYGYAALEKAGVRNGMIEAIEAAVKRAEALARKLGNPGV
jgi:pyrroline-5-carboxylate reductase